MGNDVDLDLDLAVLSKEIKLLLLFLKNERDEINFSDHEELFTDIQWDVFLQLTRHHRVYPYIYQKLKAADEKWIPLHVTQKLHQDYKKNTFHMLLLSGEMEKLCKLLADNMVNVLLLKGPFLAVELYGDLSRRTSSDIDMLVSINDLEKVHELLMELEYEQEQFFSTVLNEWKWRHHHITYCHPTRNIKLEIHWRLSPGPCREPGFYELWERRRVSSFTDSALYILGKEDMFLFLAAHGARHGWSRLRWLTDIDRLISQNPDWKQVVCLMGKNRLLQVAGQALILSSQLLNTPVTNEMKVMVAGRRPKRLAEEALFYIKQMVNLHTEPLAEDISKYHKRHLFSIMSDEQKLLYILSLLYPYPMDAETMPLPKPLHFLYFPLRPFLCAWRKVRKQALS